MLANLTFASYSELAPRFIASTKAQKKSENTVRAYEGHLNRFSEFLTEHPEALGESNEIVPLTVSDWRDRLFEDGLSPNTIHQYLGSLERFYEWAIKMKLVTENPTEGVDAPKYTVQNQDILTKEEIMKLLDPSTIPFAIRSKTPLRNYTIVCTIALTGLRSDELRELRLNDLNFEEGYVRVRNGKGGKERNAPFSKKAQDIMRNYLNAGIRPDWCSDEDYLFGTHERGLDEEVQDSSRYWHKFDSSTLGRMVKRYGMRVLGKDIHPHLLRHCAASLWDDAGANIRDVQQALGHSNITTTERIYVHILNKTKAATNINKVLGGLML